MYRTSARNRTRRPHPLSAALALLLLGTAVPAFAADPPCVDANGDPITPAPGTNQGFEVGGENTTCHWLAFACGYRNRPAEEQAA